VSFSLSGIASGLDTNTIISQLMQLEKAPYNKLQTRKTTYNSQLSVFRSINTKLSALRSAAEELKQLSAFNQYSASVSDDKVLKVTATDKAAAADYEIEVKQLAKQHSIRSIEINANDLKKTVEDFLSEKLGLVPKD
jgi:flagellar hook-associated protein 2